MFKSEWLKRQDILLSFVANSFAAKVLVIVNKIILFWFLFINSGRYNNKKELSRTEEDEFDTSLCQNQNVQYSLFIIVNVLKSLIWFNDFFGKRRLNSLPRSVSLGSSIYNISICDIGVISASAILMTHNVSVFSIKKTNSQNINNDQINVQCALLVRSKIKPGDFFVWIGKLEVNIHLFRHIFTVVFRPLSWNGLLAVNILKSNPMGIYGKWHIWYVYMVYMVYMAWYMAYMVYMLEKKTNLQQ